MKSDECLSFVECVDRLEDKVLLAAYRGEYDELLQSCIACGDKFVEYESRLSEKSPSPGLTRLLQALKNQNQSDQRPEIVAAKALSAFRGGAPLPLSVQLPAAGTAGIPFEENGDTYNLSSRAATASLPLTRAPIPSRHPVGASLQPSPRSESSLRRITPPAVSTPILQTRELQNPTQVSSPPSTSAAERVPNVALQWAQHPAYPSSSRSAVIISANSAPQRLGRSVGAYPSLDIRTESPGGSEKASPSRHLVAEAEPQNDDIASRNDHQGTKQPFWRTRELPAARRAEGGSKIFSPSSSPASRGPLSRPLSQSLRHDASPPNRRNLSSTSPPRQPMPLASSPPGIYSRLREQQPALPSQEAPVADGKPQKPKFRLRGGPFGNGRENEAAEQRRFNGVGPRRDMARTAGIESSGDIGNPDARSALQTDVSDLHSDALRNRGLNCHNHPGYINEESRPSSSSGNQSSKGVALLQEASRRRIVDVEDNVLARPASGAGLSAATAPPTPLATRSCSTVGGTYEGKGQTRDVRDFRGGGYPMSESLIEETLAAMVERSRVQKPGEEESVGNLTSWRDLWTEVVGLTSAKHSLEEEVILPLRAPRLFEGMRRGQQPKGLLLSGPAGSGKSLLAQAAARGVLQIPGVSVLIVKSPKFISMGALPQSVVRMAFNVARQEVPSLVVFEDLDDWDAVGDGSRGVASEMNFQMNLLDGGRADVQDDDDDDEKQLVVVATSRVSDQDVVNALLRKAFPKVATLDKPDMETREGLFTLATRGTKLDADVDFRRLSILTEGSTSAEIIGLCRDAKLVGVRRAMLMMSATPNNQSSTTSARLSKGDVERLQGTPLRIEDFHESLKRGRRD